MKLLAIESVYRGYDRPVLQGVSLCVEQGELLSLLGRSGCGKTTLLRMIAGYDRPEQGRILFDGAPVTGPGPDRFLVFQTFDQLFPWMRVGDNLSFALRTARPALSKQEVAEAAAFWLGETGLSAWGDSWLCQLSGGMKQRAALARAFALRPRLLLLDEPFSGLDAVLRASMQQLLRTLCEKHGVSAIFVSHDIDEALGLCPAPAVLAPGGQHIRRPAAGPGQREAILALLAPPPENPTGVPGALPE